MDLSAHPGECPLPECTVPSVKFDRGKIMVCINFPCFGLVSMVSMPGIFLANENQAIPNNPL